MNDYHEIQALLDKYWEGETSIEEERRIKNYFASGAVDERLAAFAPLFSAIREEQSVQYQKHSPNPLRPQMYQWQRFWPVAASVALLLAVGLWRLGSKIPETPLAGTTPPPIASPVAQPQTQRVESKALLPDRPDNSVAVKPVKKHRKIKPSPPATIDPEEAAAMEEIKAALALVSSKIRKGRMEAAKGASRLEEMERIFKKKEG